MPHVPAIVSPLNAIASTIAVLASLVVPAGVYGIVAHTHLVASMLSQVQLNAETINTEIIGKAPQLWQFQQVRLNELMSRRIPEEMLANEFLRLFDRGEKVVAAIGNPQPWPVVARSLPLFDAGRTVGRIEIQRSLRPLIVNGAMLSLLGIVLAAASYLTLRVIPMRAVLHADEILRKQTLELMQEVEERKRTEAALRESQQIVRTILDAIPARVFWKDKNLVYLGCNPPFAQDAGFSRPDDVVGKDDYQMGWRDQADSYRSDDRQVIETGRSRLLIEEPQTTPEGKSIALLTSKVPLRNSNGEISGVLGTYLDITERKRLEEQLSFSNLLMTTAMENAPDAIIVVDETEKIISYNTNFSDLWNIPQELLDAGADEPVLQMVAAHIADLEPFLARVKYLYEHPDEAAHDELRLKDGRVIDRHTASLRDAGNKYLGRIWYFRDITERERAAEAVKQSEARFRAIFDNARDGIALVDFQSKTFSTVNDRLCAMLGCSPDEVIGHVIDAIHPTDAMPHINQQFERHARHATNVLMDIPLRRKDGSVFFADINSATVAIGGKQYVLGIFRDITERRNAEQETKQVLQRTQLQLQTVGRVGQAEALLSGEVETLAREITELATRACGCERANVWLFNEARTELRCIDLYEATPARHSDGMVLREQDFFEEIQIIKTSKYVNADDPLTDPRTKGYVEAYIKPLRITSMLDAAIEASGQTFGLLCFEHVDKPHHWEQDEIVFAGQLADKIGLAYISRLRRQAEASLRQRDALLHAVAFAASELLTAPTLDEAIPKALRMVGNTLQIDRITVLDRPPIPDAAPILRFVWQAPTIAVALDQHFFENPALVTPQLAAWQSPLSKGRIVTADLRTATGDVSRMLESIGTKSLLVVPVFIDGKFWGEVGFEDCKSERPWPASEIEILQSLADLIGNAVRRERYVNEIADANRIVLNTPTILYRIGGEPSMPMIYVSQNIKLFGHDAAALVTSPQLYRSLVHPDDAAVVGESMAHILDKNGQRGVNTFRMMTSHGDYRWVENRYTPVRDAAGRLIEIEGLLIDITERKAAEERISLLARTDPLTGLPNRSTFIERLQQLFAAARRGATGFCVLYLDVDRFKEVNDTLGHPVGDRLLITIGERLASCIRESDMAARFGGDEFAVLQAELTDSADAGVLAVKLRAALAEPIHIGGNEIRVSASIGISIYSPDTAVPEDMLAQADVALYRAKEEGRDQYRFHTEELDVQVREQVAIADELRTALQSGEFELYYQPQVELSTNRIVGMEALIRWNHPTRGLLMPSAFIEVAERTGAMIAIGQWVLDRACEKMNSWRKAGIAPATIAVNISPVQIKAADKFFDLVTETLSKWHLDPADLELDVTESMLARATLVQSDVLERLQKIGVKLSIDDFGTKYSSLDYLKTYRVSRLKIPQVLINSATLDPESAAMVRAIAGIARELGIDVVAQGVETEAQWSYLTAASPVTKVQGFHYSEPVPGDRAEELLRRGRIVPGADRRDERLQVLAPT